AALGSKPEGHAEGLSVFKRQRIGWHRAASAGGTLDGVGQCRGEAGEAERARVRLIHHTDRWEQRLGSLDDCLQIAWRSNPLADAFETGAAFPSGIRRSGERRVGE